ncbi:MAG TPA: hypothetical protein VFB19_01725 [Mycobacterium sp.]|nr:hypothetical protein [Mycobacterium sp.]
MKTLNAFAVSMRTASGARALQIAPWPTHAASAHAIAPAAARKRRTATAAFVDRDTT